MTWFWHFIEITDEAILIPTNVASLNLTVVCKFEPVPVRQRSGLGALHSACALRHYEPLWILLYFYLFINQKPKSAPLLVFRSFCLHPLQDAMKSREQRLEEDGPLIWAVIKPAVINQTMCLHNLPQFTNASRRSSSLSPQLWMASVCTEGLRCSRPGGRLRKPKHTVQTQGGYVTEVG